MNIKFKYYSYMWKSNHHSKSCNYTMYLGQRHKTHSTFNSERNMSNKNYEKLLQFLLKINII